MELPKELTVELLGLVYGYKITNMDLKPKINDSQRLFFNYLDEDGIECEEALNIDTLTRLMKEWCFKQELENINTNIAKGVSSGRKMYHCKIVKFKGFVKILDKSFEAKTEFEAVLKAFEWVAKEKNLIDK